MSDRQWPVTKIGTAWLTYDPEDGWSEHDNPADAEREFGAIVDHLRDEASEAWHESADSAAWGVWIPIERLRLVATAWPDDDTEDGERCKDAGWDAFLDGVVERVEPDGAALEFCVRVEAAAHKTAREHIAALEAERDALRAEVRRRVPLDEYAWAIDKRDKARAERDKARAILTAALPYLERFPCVPWDGDVLARVRAWLGVSDG